MVDCPLSVLQSPWKIGDFDRWIDRCIRLNNLQLLEMSSHFGDQTSTRMSMEVIVTIDSKLGYFTYLGDVSNLLILGL